MVVRPRLANTTAEAAVLGTGDDRLTAGETRHYRVIAHFAAIAANQSRSWPSIPMSGTTRYPEKPDPPLNLGAAPAGHTSISLTWTAPDAGDVTADGSEYGASVITGYYIQYLEAEGTRWQYIKNDKGGNLIKATASGAIRRFVDTKLAPNTSREYRVASVNMIRTAEQPSDWTASVKGMTVPIPAPNAPGGLVAEAMGRNTIFLTWLAQAEVPEHAEVTGYLIQYRDGDSGNFMDLTTVMMMTPDPAW